MPHTGTAGIMEYVSCPSQVQASFPASNCTDTGTLQPALPEPLSFLKPEAWASGGKENPHFQNTFYELQPKFFAYIMLTTTL